MDRTAHELKEMLCRELEDIANKGELSAGDLEAVYKLIVAKEKLLRIEELEEELGYSNDGEWNASGMYSRDHYSGRGRRRDSMGRYSRRGYSMAEGKEMLIEQIEDMMNEPNIPQNDKMSLKRAMDQLRR